VGAPAASGAPFRRRRIAITAQIAAPAAPAPISAHPHPGRPLDSEDFDAFAAAAAPTAAAGAWLVEVVVVVVEGTVVVSVLITVFVCVGVVTVVVCAGAVTVLVWVTVLGGEGVVAGVEGVVAAAVAVAGLVCVEVVAAVAVWPFAAWVWPPAVGAAAVLAVPCVVGLALVLAVLAAVPGFSALVWLTPLATLAALPEPHPADASINRHRTITRQARRVARATGGCVHQRHTISFQLGGPSQRSRSGIAGASPDSDEVRAPAQRVVCSDAASVERISSRATSSVG
jgi:hypothetical protein